MPDRYEPKKPMRKIVTRKRKSNVITFLEKGMICQSIITLYTIMGILNTILLNKFVK